MQNSVALSQTASPTYTLYDSGAVTLAAVLGGPIPASMLIAHNYRRLGQRDDAVAALVIGVVVVAALVMLGYVLPNNLVAPIGIGLAMGARRMAISLQGPVIERHISLGGKIGSKWAAFGLTMAFLAIFCAIAFYHIFSGGLHGPKVVIGSKDTTYYNGSASREEALALGEALRTDGFFADRGVDVVLAKDRNGTSVSFVVKDGSWERPEIVSDFETIGREIAPSVGGLPLKIRLESTGLKIEKEIPVA